MPTEVAVVGAGVIGLTTAITLAEAGHGVHVLTDEPSAATTSAAAGALWGPWLAEPATEALAWARHTLDVLADLSRRPDTGVRLATGTDLTNTEHDPPAWMRLLSDRRPCAPREVPSGYRHGHRYTAPLVDMPRHLRYLARRLRQAGGTIEIGEVRSFEDIAPVVVNCAGLGATALVPDEDLYPIRGQHVVVTNPGLTDFVEVDTGDSPELIAIYPHGDHVVLWRDGATAQLGPGARSSSHPGHP